MLSGFTSRRDENKLKESLTRHNQAADAKRDVDLVRRGGNQEIKDFDLFFLSRRCCQKEGFEITQ